MLQGIKNKIPPIIQSDNPAGPPATAFPTLVIKNSIMTNKNVRSRVESMPGNARSTYDADSSSRFADSASCGSLRSPTGVFNDIVFPPWLYSQEAKTPLS
jgi:hypothetical protein